MAIAKKKRVTRTALIASIASAAVLVPAGIASAQFGAATPEVKPAVWTVEKNSHMGDLNQVAWVNPIPMGQQIVNVALSQLGSAYVWGGTTPGAFDCSGLVMWAHSQVGISTPRTSEAQWAAGKPVSLDALQPGDAIVMSGGGHIGLYIGNGMIIHAATEGVGVIIEPMSDMQVDGAVRFW